MAPAAAAPGFSNLAAVDGESIQFGYCTEFIINIHNPSEAQVLGLKHKLEALGDSLVVVADEELIKIHVHTNHPGTAIETALELGSLSNLKIDNMREQHTSKVVDSVTAAQAAAPEPESERKEVGFISVSAGDGLAEIFTNLGVDQIIQGGQTMNPSTEDVLNAIAKVNADHVVVLPNNKNIILAAEQAAELCEDKKIHVIPTKSIPQGITAMLNYEQGDPVDKAVETMKEAIESVDTGMLTFAVRDTHLENAEIHEGDVLGMKNGDIVVVEKVLCTAAHKLLELLIGDDHDMVSLYYGADTTKEDAEKLAAFIHEKYPDCEVDVQYGGQPLYYYILSAE